MTSRKLASLRKRWLERLGLTDWEEIEVTLLPKDKLSYPDSDGYAYWQPEYKKAIIDINADLDDAEIEETLVHELLHVRLEGHKLLTPKTRYDALYERALNVLATTLCKGYKRS
jgi:Zn-dependent peptidase ImmA (M78 family)